MTEAKKYDIHSLPYAYINSQHNGDYAHVNVAICNIIDLGYTGAYPKLGITCQTGSYDRNGSGKSYAWKYGISADFDLLKAEDLAALTKLMRKIEKRMEKNAYTDSYAVYCQQIMEAAGITVVFINENFAKNLPYMTGVNDLPRFHTTLQSDALIAAIAKLEHQALMATDNAYRANQ